MTFNPTPPPPLATSLLLCCLATVTVKVTDSATVGVVPSKETIDSHTLQNTSFSQQPGLEDTSERYDLFTTSTLFSDFSDPKDLISQNIDVSSCPRVSRTPSEELAEPSIIPCPAARSSGIGKGVFPGDTDNRTKLYIVGLFATDGPYPVGCAFQFAAKMAEEDINNCPDVLPGYKIVLESVNTACDPFTGMDRLYAKLYDNPTTKIMVLGGTCSGTTEQTAQASRKHNLLQVSYSTLSPRLSLPKFPWFFRLMASEMELSKARLFLLQKFNWTTITFIQAPARLFSATGEVMRNLMQEHNMTVNATYPFDTDPESTIDDLKRNDARIIYFNSYEDKARNACCVAYKKNFYGKSIVWIFPGFYDLHWYDQDDFNCSAQEKLKVINGYFTVSNVNMAKEEGMPAEARQRFRHRFQCKALQSLLSQPPPPTDTDPDPDGTDFDRQCHEQFRRQVQNKTAEEIRAFGQNPVVAGESRAPLAYDSMWTIALTLNATLTEMMENNGSEDALSEFNYDNHEMGEVIYRYMNSTSFRGLSGKINFTPTGDRRPKIEIKQFQVLDLDAAKPKVDMVSFGLYTNPSDIAWNVSLIQWAGGRPPFPFRRTERVLKPLSWHLFVVMCLLACLGLVASVAFLVFNIKNRNVRLIKMSSPKINNLILVGCMLVYCTVTVTDIHSQGLDALCHVRLYLLVMGFSLGFGALFAKTWRVYEIMTAAAGSRRLNTNALRDSRLYMIVLGLVAVNLCLLVVWTFVDAMAMTAIDIEDAEVIRDDDVLEIPQSLVCHSRYKLHFTSGLMALQALLILFGAFLAVQTRKVTIPELNDSRWVGLCIYNVVVLGSLGAILILGTRQPPDITYFLESLIVLVGTTLTQCLVFVPKLLALRRFKKGRQGSQHMVTVKTLCMSVPSSSVRSRDSKPADPEASSTGQSPHPSPNKALRKASHSLSTVLKKCCSPGQEQAAGVGGRNNNGYVDDGLEGATPPKEMVSRSVSTCDLLDLSWLLHTLEEASASSGEEEGGGELWSGGEVQSGWKGGCVDRFHWIKSNSLRPQLTNGVCVDGTLPCSKDGILKGCSLSGDPVHICCCLVKALETRRAQSLKRCLSISSLDQMTMTTHPSAEDQTDRCHDDAAVSGDLNPLGTGFVPEAPAPSCLLPEWRPPQKNSSFREDTSQDSIAFQGDPQDFVIRSSIASTMLPTVGLLFVSGGRSPDDLALLRVLGPSQTTRVTPQGLLRDSSCSSVSHTGGDSTFIAACPKLIRSASTSQLPPVWPLP